MGQALWFNYDKHTTVRDEIKRLAEAKVNCDGIPDLVPQAYRRRGLDDPKLPEDEKLGGFGS